MGYEAGPDSSNLSTATALFGIDPRSIYEEGGERVETAAGSFRWVGFARSAWIFEAVDIDTLEAARNTLLGGNYDSGIGYVTTRNNSDTYVSSDCIIRFPDVSKLRRWAHKYLAVTVEFLMIDTDSVINWGEGLMSDYVTETELTQAIATHAGIANVHHDLVSLTAALTILLGISDQELDLVAQAANTVVAGPASGADAKPTARALVDADIPAGIARDTEVTSEIALHAAIDGAHHTRYTDEEAQDAVGGILTDSSSINFSYSDETNEIIAEVDLKTDGHLDYDATGLYVEEASSVQKGVVELATETEAKTHTSFEVVLTPGSIAGIIQLNTTSDGGLVKSGSGTLTLAASDAYTLTVPATGTVALLGTTQTFSGAKTFSDNITITSGKWIGNASDGVRVVFDNTTDSERLEVDVASLIQFDGYRTPSYAASETGVILRGPNARSIFVELRNNDADDRFSIVVDPDNAGGPDTEVFTVTGDGRIGFNAHDPVDLIELHIESGESGGLTISRGTSDLVAELYQSGGGNSVGVFRLYSSNTANVQLNAYSGGTSFVNNTLGVATTSPSISDGKGVHIGGAIIRLDTSKTPSSASDTGNQGEICWDSSYVYVCTATNTWKRVAIATW